MSQADLILEPSTSKTTDKGQDLIRIDPRLLIIKNPISIKSSNSQNYVLTVTRRMSLQSRKNNTRRGEE